MDYQSHGGHPGHEHILNMRTTGPRELMNKSGESMHRARFSAPDMAKASTNHGLRNSLT